MSEYAALIAKVKESFAELIDSLIAAVETLSSDLAAERRNIEAYQDIIDKLGKQSHEDAADLAAARREIASLREDEMRRRHYRHAYEETADALSDARREKEEMRERTIEECASKVRHTPIPDELKPIDVMTWNCALSAAEEAIRALSAQPECACGTGKICPHYGTEQERLRYCKCGTGLQCSANKKPEHNDPRMERIAKAFGVGPLAAQDVGSDK